MVSINYDFITFCSNFILALHFMQMASTKRSFTPHYILLMSVKYAHNKQLLNEKYRKDSCISRIRVQAAPPIFKHEFGKK